MSRMASSDSIPLSPSEGERMTERVRMLREQSLAAIPVIAHERALLVTESAMGTEGLPAPLRRAHAFRYLMERETVVINDGELIVGERGPAPRATSTYPELCCHTLGDLEILDTREKIAFRVSDETKEVYRERIIPYWRGKTMRERIFAAKLPTLPNPCTAKLQPLRLKFRSRAHSVTQCTGPLPVAASRP